MSNGRDPREWRYLRLALAILAVVAVVDVVAWELYDRRHPPPTRLELSVRCLTYEKGVTTSSPSGDLLADSAGDGSFRTTIEGNEVTVALASSEEQAAKIERTYRVVGGDLRGRLERRFDTVYLWKFESSPTQRQAMYDCRY